MHIIINNKKVKIDEKKLTLAQLLENQNILFKKGIAVAVNNEVIPSSQWPAYELKDNDQIIIVTATQGG